MIMQNQVFTAPQEEMSSHLIKCVLKKPEFLVIEGKQYICGVKTRQLEILVSDLTKDAVLEMLLSIGLSAWELVDWWAVEMFSLSPCF